MLADLGRQEADHLVGRAVEVEHVLGVAPLEVEDAEMLGVGQRSRRGRSR